MLKGSFLVLPRTGSPGHLPTLACHVGAPGSDCKEPLVAIGRTGVLAPNRKFDRPYTGRAQCDKPGIRSAGSEPNRRTDVAFLLPFPVTPPDREKVAGPHQPRRLE
jgi:hypothetical protein